MAIKKTDKGWFLHIDRAGMPRVRRNFRSESKARAFECAHLDKYEPRVGADRRTLSVLIKLWYEYHGQTLSAPEPAHNILKAICKDLNNPMW